MLRAWNDRRSAARVERALGLSVTPEQVAILQSASAVLLPSLHPLYLGAPQLRRSFAVADQTQATKERVLQVAAALSGHASWPSARALHAAAVEAGLAIPVAERVAALVDGSVEGRVLGARYILGDEQVASQQGIPLGIATQALVEQFTMAGWETRLLVSRQPKRLEGVLAIGYELNPSMVSAVQSLKKRGLEPTLLTTLRTKLARVVTQSLGVDRITSELTEEDRERMVRSFVKQNPTGLALGMPVEGLLSLGSEDCTLSIPPERVGELFDSLGRREAR